jgi:hypothetical protein
MAVREERRGRTWPRLWGTHNAEDAGGGVATASEQAPRRSILPHETRAEQSSSKADHSMRVQLPRDPRRMGSFQVPAVPNQHLPRPAHRGAPRPSPRRAVGSCVDAWIRGQRVPNSGTPRNSPRTRRNSPRTRRNPRVSWSRPPDASACVYVSVDERSVPRERGGRPKRERVLRL